MANGILDFFSREAGQQRRKALDEAIEYYTPPNLRGLLGFAAEMTPTRGIERAGLASQKLFASDTPGWDRVSALGDMASEIAGVVAPAAIAGKVGMPAAQALQEGLMGFSTSPQGVALRNFTDDESGALRLWHGSPHDFDKFSMDKIGTGEGAQAYGHGLYFAEAEDVAKQYRDQLSRGWKPSEDYIWRGKDAATHYQDAISRGDYGKALVWEQVQLHGTRDAIRQDLLDEIAGGSNQAKAALEFLNTLPDELFAKPSGRMYEVNVNANPEDFLDWDKPLSEQSTKVRDAIEKVAPIKVFHSRLGNEYRAYLEGPGGIAASFSGATRDEAMEKARRGLTGENIVRSNVPTMLSRDLSGAGIPGIRYLDQGSRGAGEGSRNYVVFDDRLIDVLGKDGARTTPEGRAQGILDLLTSGRASEVTDEMLDLGDPVANARLNQYLFRNYDLPMDEASRMARAKDFDASGYHGTRNDFTAFSPPHKAGVDSFSTQQPVFAGYGPSVANEAARPLGGNVIPLRARLSSVFDPEIIQDAPDARWLDDSWSPLGRKLVDDAGAGRLGDDIDDPEGYAAAVASGQWDVIESDAFQKWMRAQGFDDFRVNEAGAQNFAVTDPARIRSRFARFDPRLAHLKNLSAGIVAAPLGLLALRPQDEQY